MRGLLLSQGVLLVAAALGTAAASQVTVKKSRDTIGVQRGDAPVLVYRYRPNPFKVYIQALSTPAGVQILRDSPHDHVHHHALMFAVGADAIDFWGEHPKSKPGKQMPRGDVTAAADPKGATIQQSLDWRRPDQDPVLAEQRRIIVHDATPIKATLLTWRARLTPAEGRERTKLWGRHYFGLGMRFVTAMDTGGRFIHPTGEAGEKVRGSEKLVRAPWCAYTAAVDGKPVTVAIFDHPSNPRHPATWFTMTQPFAYLAATLNLHRQPMTLAKGQPLELVYGVALWDGAIDADAIAEAWRRWQTLATKPAGKQ